MGFRSRHGGAESVGSEDRAVTNGREGRAFHIWRYRWRLRAEWGAWQRPTTNMGGSLSDAEGPGDRMAAARGRPGGGWRLNCGCHCPPPSPSVLSREVGGSFIEQTSGTIRAGPHSHAEWSAQVGILSGA